MSRAIFIVIFALTCLTFLTEAVPKTPDSSSNIQSLTITNCNVPPCPLKKGNIVSVEEVFSVNKDISKLKTKVSANVLGLNLPFIGVDDYDACPNIYNMDDTKSGCPLSAGGIYKYKNSFKIQGFYPNIKTTVYWKLVEELNQRKSNVITCFQVDAQIKR
ncbi:Similar to NPC2: NPC intracellular cholesterol transporter 2 (Bos taurus) [Cotesia congregata]|uniref:Similar to NPC2: NPC intracellular cholesterol transporter 2 (Bos taurus) n=1 Tax=Cotesia congregata TaxID=51543 RepID=A0A8J2HNL6_COTCN|nr:Similar to NPC2: NPC intracellular cholesterol transporter 2 (Bos taurus) [Cotesia congregata]